MKTEFILSILIIKMDEVIKQIESVDLTGEDLTRICRNQIEVVPYHTLNKYNSIEDLLKKFGAVILLYETKENFGHYTALFYDINNQLEFFDSYGLSPDSELKYATYNLNEGVPFLTLLLKKYTKPINYNKVKFQAFIKDMNTCGRWTSTRIRLRKKYTLPQFTKLFQSNKHYNGDWYVSALTYLYTIKD